MLGSVHRQRVAPRRVLVQTVGNGFGVGLTAGQVAYLADTAVLNLVPMVLERLEAGESPQIFGDDYATPDGTCVRDFAE